MHFVELRDDIAWSQKAHSDGDRAVTARWRNDFPVKQRTSCNLPCKPINFTARAGYESNYSFRVDRYMKKQNMSITDIRCLHFYYIFMCYKSGLTSTQTVAYVHQLRVI